MPRATHIEYDALNHPVTTTLNYRPGEPESANVNVTTVYSYNLVGDLLRMVDPEGNPAEYVYDLLSRITRMRDAESREWEYQYDPLGNLTRLIDPREITTTLGYDMVYRPISVTQNFVAGSPVDSHTNVTTRFEYDLNGNRINVIDPLDVVTHFEYDELDRPILEIRNYRPGFAETAEINVTTEYTYDLAGNLRFVTDPRRFKAELVYDAAFRLTDAFDYEQAHSHFDYDRVDNLLTLTDDNSHTTHYYGYDDLNRLISVTNPETHTVSLGYDKMGNLTGTVDANGTPAHFDVDALNRVVMATLNYQPGQPATAITNVTTPTRMTAWATC